MLTIQDLNFRYPNSNETTLKALNFSIAKGEIFGFLGPSGAGKSTTQKILYKLLPGYTGEIFFKGKPLQQWSRDFYEQIGVSFELPNHYLKLTAEENLRFFSSFYKNPITDFRELLAKVDLEPDRKKLVSEFSKGMKMRLNLVRSLLHNPDMLFLDEPTSGLDPINGNRIKDIIKALKQQGKTIFISTHNMVDADQLCDRVALLHKGEIKALDTPANLKLKHGNRTVKITTSLPDKQELIFPMQNIGQNTRFLNTLLNNPIDTIHSQEATLEEVFIKLTGEQLV